MIVLDGFAKIMAGCKSVDEQEASNMVSACGSGRSEAVDERHQRRRQGVVKDTYACGRGRAGG